MQEDLICQECPNGCPLKVEWRDDFHALIAGNKCHRGIGQASRMLRRQKNIHVLAKDKTPAFSETALKEVASLWGVSFGRARYDIFLQGSPERAEFRVAFEDEAEGLFVLEQIPIKNLTLKRRIAETLIFLSKQGLAHIQPYCSSIKGEYVTKHKSDFWQMMPFVPGVALDRNSYMHESWRGPLLARFLIALAERSKDMPFSGPQRNFSLKNYVYRLVGHLKGQDLSVQKKITDVMDFLEKDFMGLYNRIPVAFCHGDYHPMNIIWSEKDMRCVIDWEFSGYKSEIYDVANLIGCIGIEDPQCLTGSLVEDLIFDIKNSRVFSDMGLSFLIEHIVALRFAWLSEWLRRRDAEMVLLETDYMALLIKNKDILRSQWRL